jgi:DNA uptake protein ComE-like DNA-binding protein
MKINLEPLRSWFGYTRRERRSSFILLILIIVILGSRVAVPEKNITIEDYSDSISYTSDINASEPNVPIPAVKSKSFNKAEPDTVVKKKNVHVYTKKALVNLNSCDTAELISLPGIGPVLSLRIIKYRNLLGGYAAVSQLIEVYGLPPETFDLIKELVYADTTMITRISINSAGYKEISKLPYFEKYEVQAILKYRELKGRIGGITELVDNKLIPSDKGPKIKPYLKFE